MMAFAIARPQTAFSHDPADRKQKLGDIHAR